MKTGMTLVRVLRSRRFALLTRACGALQRCDLLEAGLIHHPRFAAHGRHERGDRAHTPPPGVREGKGGERKETTLQYPTPSARWAHW
jgi:hypothetical protein